LTYPFLNIILVVINVFGEQCGVNGGLVKDAIRFPRSDKLMAVRGIWSGGQWAPQKNILVYQYREQMPLGIWQMVGVDSLSGSDVALILSPFQENVFLAKNDVLIFGEGAYTTLPVSETTLPTDSDCSIEFGAYHGIALLNRTPAQVIIFHQDLELTLTRSDWQPVWWRGKAFSIRVSSNQYVIKSDLKKALAIRDKVLGKIYPEFAV
jgi:hypothetical protein